MAIEKDNVYITTDMGEYACRKSIDAKDAIKEDECMVIEHKNLVNYPSYKLKNRQGTLFPFSELGDMEVYAVKSHIYKDTFYPIQHFDQMYREDLFSVMTAIASRLGAKSIEFRYLQKQDIERKEKKQKSGQASVDARGVTIDAKGAQEDSRDYYSEEKWSECEKHDGLSDRRWGKEELREYIDKENIAIDALPRAFRERLKRYLDDGEVSGSFEKTEKMDSFVKDNAKKNMDLKMKLDAKKIIGINLQLNSDCSFQEKNSFTSEIKYRVEF